MKKAIDYIFNNGKYYPLGLTFPQVNEVFSGAQSPKMPQLITDAKGLSKPLTGLSILTTGGGFTLSIPDFLFDGVFLTWVTTGTDNGALTVNGVTYGSTGSQQETYIECGDGVNALKIKANTPLTIIGMHANLTDETTETLQTFGTNTDAQNIVNETIRDTFPTLGESLVYSVVEKFYRWRFCYNYAKRSDKWRKTVRAWCNVNKKLAELERLYSMSLGEEEDGHFWESWSGSDSKSIDKKPVQVTQDFTDNLARENITTFKGVGSTTTSATADKSTQSPVDGKNTQKNITKTEYQGVDVETTQKGTSRKYSDGRTIKQRINDIMSVNNPIQSFVGGFAQFLIEPCDEGDEHAEVHL